VRISDTVARLGGDEFVIKLNNLTDKNVISSIASGIIKVVNEPMEIRGEVVQVSASMGIAIFPADGHTSLDLIKNADAAMYAAKDSGKNTYCFFTPG
jgi:diguanylate cyclase (GGDEF)-like protein